ncbi:MAG: Hsp20/alpha crystallin family protein [Treponema sp.]|nr:Hsp20/alpha crystallin family protein [Treponema sp.]
MRTLTIHPSAIQNVMSDFDRCFAPFFGDTSFAPAAKIFKSMPAVDIRETENAYVLEMELPGYDEKNIEIHVDGSGFSITSKQEEKKTEDEVNYLLHERRVSSFRRAFKMPENADPEAVSASFKNGVLCMEIKKRAAAQTRIIQINAA